MYLILSKVALLICVLFILSPFESLFAQCSLDQVKILVNALYRMNEKSWGANQKIDVNINSVIHEILFDTNENILKENRTPESTPKRRIYF